MTTIYTGVGAVVVWTSAALVVACAVSAWRQWRADRAAARMERAVARRVDLEWRVIEQRLREGSAVEADETWWVRNDLWT